MLTNLFQALGIRDERDRTRVTDLFASESGERAAGSQVAFRSGRDPDAEMLESARRLGEVRPSPQTPPDSKRDHGDK